MVRRELWSNLIDYAGVFPPARHPLTEALIRYRTARADPDGWILGPCLIKASQLAQLEHPPDCLGIVVDAPDLSHTGHRISQIEMKVTPAATTHEAAVIAGLAPVLYLESRQPDDLGYLDQIASLRKSGIDARAKIRTGGVSVDLFPSISAVSSFICRCLELGIPFKATAGLHNPFRHPSSVEGATEHGFINILAAVRAALAGAGGQVEAALGAADPAEFDVGSATWNGVGADIPDTQVRQSFASFGSCSFSEPADYLRDLGVLPERSGRHD